jgi:hypothetical protein
MPKSETDGLIGTAPCRWRSYDFAERVSNSLKVFKRQRKQEQTPGHCNALSLLALPRLSHVANTYDEFSKAHPERHSIHRGNIVRLQQGL